MNNRYRIIVALLVMCLGAACRKTEFADIENPAYLRVFNSLDYQLTLGNKDAPQTFLTMLIDPVLDKDGIPESAAITGDFLDKRDSWARPYPDAVNTSIWQKEYPGSLKVLAGPILNGYDLSSWAQVPSGKHRILFRTRPYSNTPFFSLEKNLRGVTLVDTTVELQSYEVYTMHVLEQVYETKKTGLYIRNETFVKQPLSDSFVYVNFYNLSSQGYFDFTSKVIDNNAVPNRKMEDKMTVYYSLGRPANNVLTPIAGFNYLPLGAVTRSQDTRVAPYYSFPLFPDTSANKIFTGNMAQVFYFCAPGLTPFNIYNTDPGQYSAIAIGDYGYTAGTAGVPYGIKADLRTGLIISTHSGVNNPRSFATVNTLEFINDKFYLMTIQRKYAPPIY